MSDTIPFPDYAPDITPLGQADSQVIFNVVPKSDGYGPILSMTQYTQSLPAPCRGYFYGRKPDGTVTIVAGTATDLYIMNPIDLSWTLASKGGRSYGAVPTDDNWVFVQYNDLIIAVQKNCPPQKLAQSTSNSFVDLGGNPPYAGWVAIIGFFVVLTAIQEAGQRVQWSDLDAPEQWSAGIGLSDFQDFPDGGSSLVVSGGDAYGTIFQEQSIRSMTYAAGSVAIFQFYRFSTQEVLFAKYSVINVSNRVFYLSAAGFREIVSTADPVDIGKDKVNITFFNDVDAAQLQLIIAAVAPTATRVYWAYKTKNGAFGAFDRILVYDYVLNKWARVNISGEYLASLAKPGLTLENMDAYTLEQLYVKDAKPSATGSIILTLDAVVKPSFNLAAQPFATVQGIKGTTEANGVWRFNIIDDTHVEEIGSSFVNAYISGGAIGGSIEAMTYPDMGGTVNPTFSFDDIVKAAIAQLSAFDATHALNFFTGPALEATLETGEGDGKGKMIFTTAMRPITDATQVYCSVGFRNSPQGIPVYTMENLIDDMGMAPIDPIESRYQRIRVRIEAGSSWTYVRGAQPETEGAGDR